MTRLSLPCAGTCLALLLLVPRVGQATATWRIDPVVTGEGGATAVAAGTDGRFAVGDARGATSSEPGGVVRRIDLAADVRDLAFDAGGALWIASGAGLFRYVHGRAVLHTPAPGEAARDALHVSAAAGVVAVATGAGVYWSRDGERFAPIDAAEGEFAVGGLAIERTPDADVLVWIAADRGLFVAALVPELRGVRAELASAAGAVRPALDVAVADGRLLVLGHTQLVARGADGRFRSYRPALPPGATPLRVAAAPRQVWIATDRGLLAAPSPAGRFERAPAPAGAAVAADVAVTPEGVVLVATTRGLVTGGPESPGAEPVTSVAGCDPPVLAVQRAALAYLELRGDPARAMRRGVRLRGLFPVVTLEAAKRRDRDEGWSYDEAFISGAYHQLRDRDDGRERDEEVGVRLSWDLGDAVYNPEQVDVSTEARRLLELRDDVLDEVNQLYFDRQRSLAAGAAAPSDSPDALRESLRAAELAAGLDAWTDGWFSARATCAAAP